MTENATLTLKTGTGEVFEATRETSVVTDLNHQADDRLFQQFLAGLAKPKPKGSENESDRSDDPSVQRGNQTKP